MILGALLGALVGIVMGLIGAGGGVLAVPLLIFGLNLTVADAGPISLLAVGISAGVGTLIGLKAGIVRYRAALLIASSGVLFAPLGIWLARRMDTRLLSLLFAAVLAWVAYRTFKEVGRSSDESNSLTVDRPCIRDDMSGRFIWTSKCAGTLSIAGAIAGVLSGLLGVGGGFVTVPALQRSTDLMTQSIVATSLAVIALVSLTGVAASMSAENFNVNVALPFAIGSLVGIGVGSVLTSRLSPKYLKVAFALICLLVAIGMIAKSF